MIKLLGNEQPKGIPVGLMKDGDVGVIVSWSTGDYIGQVVQRYKNYIITVGQSSGYGLGEYFAGDCNSGNRVRLLEPGEKLIVT